MSSGNPYGLSEIQHFGTFQRVGGKAGGFISKKFFHPSSFRNQEKLWKAQTEHERQTRKQIELEKRRDEERQVEEIRKQMYLAGQGKASDFIASTVEEAVQSLPSSQRTEMKASIEELRRRKALLKQERETAAAAGASDSEEGDEEEEGVEDGEEDRQLAKSRYKEDVHVKGHTSVWGSWFATDVLKWGFACCKSKEREVTCALAPEPVEEAAPVKEPRGRKRRRGSAAERGSSSGVPAGAAAASAEGGLRDSASSSAATQASSGTAAAAAPSLLLAARERKRREAEERTGQEKEAKSGYLADLLQDPSATR